MILSELVQITINETFWNILGTISATIATVTAVVLATNNILKERRNRPKFKIKLIEDNNNYKLHIINEGLGTALQSNLRLSSVSVDNKEYLKTENISKYVETLGDLQNGESDFKNLLSKGPGGIIFRRWSAGVMPLDSVILITLKITGHNFQAHELKIKYDPEQGFRLI